jgi:hypothetical protein
MSINEINEECVVIEYDMTWKNKVVFQVAEVLITTANWFASAAALVIVNFATPKE